MNCCCKDFFKVILIFVVIFILGCPQPKKQEYKVEIVKDKNLILENSSSVGWVGPIPEWVLEMENFKEIQKSEKGVFFIMFVEADKIVEIDPKSELTSYLFSTLPDAKNVVDLLVLKLSGKYWHKLKKGSYQIFYRYEITQDSIKNAIRVGKFSEKSEKFLKSLVD